MSTTDVATFPTPSAVPVPPGGPLEIVFSFDTTGSMSRCIQTVRTQLATIINRLLADIPHIRVGVFAHGDYCDAYVTKWLDFTNDVTSLCEFVRDVQSTYGGDEDECYELVLRQVREKLSWTPGTQRALVMIGDACPHPPSYAQNTDNIDWEQETAMLSDIMGVRIYSVMFSIRSDGEYTKKTKQFFSHMAERTGGTLLNPDSFDTIVDMMMAICYRETGPDFLEAYEREVRAREGAGIRQGLDNMFTALRDGAGSTTGTALPAAAPGGAAVAGPSGLVARGSTKRSRSPSPSSDSGMESASSGSGLPDRKRRRTTTTRAALYKKDRKPARESIKSSDWEFKDLEWSRWQAFMAPDVEPSSRGKWLPRRGGRPGYRNARVLHDLQEEPAVYELGVQSPNSSTKCPVKLCYTHGFRGSRHASYLLRQKVNADRVDKVLQRGCKLFLRCAVMGKGGRRIRVQDKEHRRGRLVKTVSETAKLMTQMYDYAWARGGRRENGGVSHGDKSDVSSDMDTSGSCTCVMCTVPDSADSAPSARVADPSCPCVMCTV